MPTLIDKFYQAALQRPDKLAIRDHGRDITYRQLSNQIDSLAGWLFQQHFKKGDRIGIHLSNSIEYIVAYYACWRAGLIPVSLNTLASKREISFWLSNSGCCLLFSQRLAPEDVDIPLARPGCSTEEVLVNDCSIKNAKADLNFPKISPADIATIIYTSGTTGNPKGITLSHENLTANAGAIIQSVSIVADDSFLCVLPFFYSYGNSILHTHLAVGATLVLLNQVTYPAEILRTIQDFRCTGFGGVPSTYITLLRKTDFNDFDLSSLKQLTQAGGHLPKEFAVQLRNRLPQAKLFIMYGQTEASARISCLDPDFIESKPGSVGRPLPNISVSILDKHHSECAVGETGEICVDGPNVMKGYWNNPRATEKVLVNNRLHTGDMGYLDAEGFLYIVGRQSEILKISDHRVSPYEIEEVLMGFPGVEECAVIGCSHQQMGQFARAFVVRNDSNVGEMQLKKHCKNALASYKIPKEILFVDDLPKTSSGKIKRDHLQCQEELS